MKIAVASGKGGTGKTTVATSLAVVAADSGQSVAYADCDVEEPNGHLFLRPKIADRRPVTRTVPEVNQANCTLCGECGEICQFSAIVCLGRTVLVYPELCHACGGCTLVCPGGAIREVHREIGRLENGRAGAIHFVHGLLHVGEAMSTPLIREVRKAVPDVALAFIDSPPGTSCPVIESVRGCDYVVLVTEPTPFGLHDLKLAVDMVRALGLFFGVVINRAGMGDMRTRDYCRAQGIEVLAEIPDDRRIAEAYSRGELACEQLESVRVLFERIWRQLQSKKARRAPAAAQRGAG
ncbi:MAG: hypothetical protein AMXMBFR13_49520 [Phycisphaerae bacterium]